MSPVIDDQQAGMLIAVANRKFKADLQLIFRCPLSEWQWIISISHGTRDENICNEYDVKSAVWAYLFLWYLDHMELRSSF